jgi:hypothetical protein
MNNSNIINILKTGFLILLLSMQYSCSDNDEKVENYPNYIKGTWIATTADEDDIDTNDMFIMKCDGKHQVYGIMKNLGNNNFEWQEKDYCTYSFNKNILIIQGSNDKGHSTYLEMNILNLNSNTLIYTTQKLKIDGQEISDPLVYKMEKSTNNYSTEITGCWKGHCTTTGVAATAFDNYWEFHKDGTYDYYYYDAATEKYVKKSDNDGKYFIHGNLLACNYTHGILADEYSGKNCECWTIKISGDKMTWEALRNGKTENYEMIKSTAPVLQ